MQLVIAGFAGMLLLVQAAVPLRAQETRTLTLQEAVQLGIENSKQLKISLAKADAAESKYQQTMGIIPTPGIAILINLATLQPFQMDFNHLTIT